MLEESEEVRRDRKEKRKKKGKGRSRLRHALVRNDVARKNNGEISRFLLKVQPCGINRLERNTNSLWGFSCLFVCFH